MTKLVNLTPHAVNFVTEGGEPVLTVEPEAGTPAPRVKFRDREGGRMVDIDGVTIEINAGKERVGIVDLPEPAEDTLFVVSRFVIEAAPERDDLVAPDGMVRDADGKVVGCTRLSR